MTRSLSTTRKTSETKIAIAINLDGTGRAKIQSGIGFLDHMLCTLAKHSGINLEITCIGDLEVDDHHTSEDIAITIGQAIDHILSERRGINRFGYAYAPLDEALARTVIDLSGRPHANIHLNLKGQSVGNWHIENVIHFFESLATACKAAIHVDILKGTNDHHRIEAAFKSLALALRQAVSINGSTDIPSTKGIL